ncbi:MAG TPA: prolipoprotein diacylglyceryl transferase family protein [Streptosporangiaceae bacterium]|jgi:phosphatidylglycerol:prolipoprotein diacylglycerol transferase
MGSKTRRTPRTGSRQARAAQPAVPGRDAAPAELVPPVIPPGLARAAPPSRPVPSAAAPEEAPGGWAAVQREAMRQGLTATCWLDPGGSGPVTVRFTGHRTGISGAPGRGDRFEREETAEGVLPGSGPVSVTARITDVNPGEWQVRARVAARPGSRQRVTQTGLPDAGSRAHVLRRAVWPKGNPVPAQGPGDPAGTRLAALATRPGIVPGSWAAAVAAGVALALSLLTVLLGRVHIGAGRALAVAAVVILAGVIDSRLWYVMLQRGKTEGLVTQGLCIQGAVAGGALAAVPALLIASVPVGTFFDAATPGLFFAMAVGRQGCFLSGCCVGRLTASRFGIWSSDGRVGARRLPAQQLEALACLLIGAAALVAFLLFGREPGGAIFAGAMAVYVMARQGLLALRAERRRWPLAGPVTLVAAAAALLADIAVAAAR